ncbi:RCC1 domain-containing protein [Candidatus Oscillochloris fontis]|uniref:RCC1 domain-containing protein n=1 Tax=Candidatus Oscillochloris fontis TaxID=2496868 RepID=UPI00237A8429|nr:RCC1 domain-containing protein [Candidatus Oscillochloris fontis]
MVLGILAAPSPSTSDRTALAAPAPQAGERVASVSVGWEHVCALMETGAVRCWGSNARNQTNVPSDLGAVRQISAGFFHTCAVTQAGELRCWGSSSLGMDIPPDLGTVAYVSAGAELTCAITTSGTLRCWGDPTILYDQPTDIGPVIDVTVSHSIPGTGAICATTTAGLIRCWGNLISADVLDSRAVYTNPDLREQVIIGGMYVCVIGVDKLLRCGSEDEPIDFGMVSQGSMDISNNICAVTVDGALRCEDINVPTDIGSVRQVSTWQAYTCAVTTSGGLRCWENTSGAELVNIAGSGAAGTGNTTTIPASELPTGLVYSAGGRQYQVHLDTNSSTTVGIAPPASSILGSGNTRIWIEMADWQNNQEPFQILQSNVDGSNQQILLDSSTFYQQFPDYISLYSKYGTGIPPKLVINTDKSQIFFPACQQGMGESAICTMFQFDLNSRTVNRLTWLHFESRGLC